MQFGVWTYQEAQLSIFAIDAKVMSVDTVCAYLDAVANLPTQYPIATTVDTPDGPIAWYNYEHLIWAIGEKVRQMLKERRPVRSEAAIWTRVEAICAETAFGRGRESFTMLLGQYGGLTRVPLLLALLDDVVVCGHALYALRLLGAPDAIPMATQLLSTGRPWVRREAKKYLASVKAPGATGVVP